MMVPMIVPGLTDRRLKNGWTGDVFALLGDGKKERVARVYGATIEEMRRRKHAIANALRDDRWHERKNEK